jgi:hypothetical protein
MRRFIGIMAKIGLAPLTTSGKLSSSERRPAVNVDPVVKIGTLYQWEEQKVNVKANVAITKHLQKVRHSRTFLCVARPRFVLRMNDVIPCAYICVVRYRILRLRLSLTK